MSQFYQILNRLKYSIFITFKSTVCFLCNTCTNNRYIDTISDFLFFLLSKIKGTHNYIYFFCLQHFNGFQFTLEIFFTECIDIAVTTDTGVIRNIL